MVTANSTHPTELHNIQRNQLSSAKETTTLFYMPFSHTKNHTRTLFTFPEISTNSPSLTHALFNQYP